ncbi:hypothetical protein P5673_020789 [Acropora cervicornis]|uniref:Uncharacterized protein n=1 Tax=Acropora cervicornis TaxID=6130 RepID=A0AAD9Q923_ACRCE|nr:hypothetical protein P5673_020789 [Acropora cervicornis]
MRDKDTSREISKYERPPLQKQNYPPLFQIVQEKSIHNQYYGQRPRVAHPRVAGPNPSPYMVSTAVWLHILKVLKFPIELFELWGELHSFVYSVGALQPCLAFGIAAVGLASGKSIANAFNDFFANIGSKLANSIPPATKSPLSHLPAEKPNSFYLLPVTSNEIEEVISTLNVKKACGPFSIPTKLLKRLKCLISKPLEIIFNASFTTRMVPDNFKVAKVAKVIPIHKKRMHTNLGNYRLISLVYF